MTPRPALVPGADRPLPVVVELPITLGQFVKVAGLAGTGGEAKYLVAAGLVRVNSQVEMRRGHRLRSGDIVESQGTTAEVVARSTPERPAAERD